MLMVWSVKGSGFDLKKMDWESKFSSIVRETEANIAKVKVYNHKSSIDKRTDAAQNIKSLMLKIYFNFH